MTLAELKTATRLADKLLDLANVAMPKIGQVAVKASDPDFAELKECATALGEALRDAGLYRPKKRT